jgi:hypothetical protein
LGCHNESKKRKTTATSKRARQTDDDGVQTDMVDVPNEKRVMTYALAKFSQRVDARLPGSVVDVCTDTHTKAYDCKTKAFFFRAALLNVAMYGFSDGTLDH